MAKSTTRKSFYNYTIPRDWKVSTLIEISVNGISNGVFNDPKKVGKGYRLINVLDLYNEPCIDTSKLKLLNIDGNVFTKNKVMQGDLFFTRSSLKLEGIAFCNICLEDANDITYDGHIMKITPNKEIIYSPYLRLYCIGTQARKYFMSNAKQNTMTTIGQDDISHLQIPLPSILEQKAIAQLISTWDNAIAKTQKIILQKESRKKWLMQNLLNGEKRLTRYEKEKWKMKLLGDVLDPISRPASKPLDAFLALGIRSHGKGTFLKHDFEPNKIEMDTLFVVRENDLIVNITFAWEGAIAIVKKEDDGALVSHRFPTFTFNPDAGVVNFFKYIILQPKFKYMLDLISPGGAGRNRVLSKKDFLNLEIKIPSIECQLSIARVLQAADIEIQLLKSKFEKLNVQKKSLMKALLMGEKRLVREFMP